MNFIADESCDVGIVNELRSAGFDVTTVRDVSPGASDIDVMALARSSGRILLTEDKDFG